MTTGKEQSIDYQCDCVPDCIHNDAKRNNILVM